MSNILIPLSAAHELASIVSKEYIDSQTKRQDSYKYWLLETLWPKRKTVKTSGDKNKNIKFGAENRMKVLSKGNQTFQFSGPTLPQTVTYAMTYLQSGYVFDEFDINEHGFTIDRAPGGQASIKDLNPEMITRFKNVIQETVEDYTESYDRELNMRLWNDGLMFPGSFPGIFSFIHEDPTVSRNVFGINQASQPKWRNAFATGIVASGSDAPITDAMNAVLRSTLKHGRPTYLALAGGDFHQAYMRECRKFSVNNSTNGASTTLGSSGTPSFTYPALVTDIKVEYDPVLDLLGKQKHLYLIDMSAYLPMVLEGRDKKETGGHAPHDELKVYFSQITAAGMAMMQRNTSAVLTIQ